jgi:type I restriction enzyme, R subunit
LLMKPNLKPAQTKKIKSIAKDLLRRLKAEKLAVHLWRDKESTRDAVKTLIRNFLWSDDTGLPVGVYSEADVEEKADSVYRHVYRAYPAVPSPYYRDNGGNSRN